MTDALCKWHHKQVQVEHCEQRRWQDNVLVQQLSRLHVKYADRTVNSIAVDDKPSPVGWHVEASIGTRTQRRNVQATCTLARRQLPECHGAVFWHRYQLMRSEQEIYDNLHWNTYSNTRQCIHAPLWRDVQTETTVQSLNIITEQTRIQNRPSTDKSQVIMLENESTCHILHPNP